MAEADKQEAWERAQANAETLRRVARDLRAGRMLSQAMELEARANAIEDQALAGEGGQHG